MIQQVLDVGVIKSNMKQNQKRIASLKAKKKFLVNAVAVGLMTKNSGRLHAINANNEIARLNKSSFETLDYGLDYGKRVEMMALLDKLYLVNNRNKG